ncbi:MAG TPA: tetratricopeptide repeat protein [Kofleriaceae bacterium]|jgi:tetratricopeptide (TPR) repeat protein
MNRLRDRATFLVGILTISAVVCATGCEELDGRNRTRRGNTAFRATEFIDAAAQYEKALKTVPDPIVHYNAGLTYSKIFKPIDAPVRLGVKGTFVCDQIPNTKSLKARVCLKDGDRRFEDCDEKNVCASSFKCTETELCVMDEKAVADASAKHFEQWLAANPKDDDTRELMTKVWEDSEQSDLAIKYWEELLAKRPGDTEIMGNLAGISLRAGKWRESVDWYLKVANAATEQSQKVTMYQNIGNVAWNKLNSKTLTGPESIELADIGIGALQQGAAIAPKNPKLWGLQASLLNFRAINQGQSWAVAIERAVSQDLQKTSRVLSDEAKKAQGETTPAAAGSAPPTTPAPAAAGGSASKPSAGG